MDLQAENVAVDGPRGPLLRSTSLRVRIGEPLLVSGEPGTGHTALALCLAGQLRPGAGTVRTGGRDDPAELRRRVAIVDAPQVSAPDDGLTLSTVVAEELAFAGRRAGRRAVRDWLAQREAGQYASGHVEHVPGGLRTALLTELAALRPGIGALVIDSPDRHGGDPSSWWETAMTWSARGLSVAVLCGSAPARLLGVPAVQLGNAASAAA
jgi:ABC-type uncharacterized transport system ATPase component